VIIRRQIKTFLAAGFDVAVIDQGEGQKTETSSSYRHIKINRLEWHLVTKTLWPIVRRVRYQKLDDQFWRFVLWLRAASNVIRLAHVAFKEGPDCYVAEDLQSAWAAILASRFRRRPVIYNAHELESEQGYGDTVRVQRGFLRSLEQKLVPQVDYLVVPNHSRAAVYAKRYGVRNEPVIVLNCPPASPVPKSNKLREALGLPDSVRLVLYHGALIPYRSLDKLVQSAAYFEKDIALVIIGEQGSYFREVLAPLCVAEQLQDRVVFLPYISPDRIASYVASADLGVVIYENVNLNNYLCAPAKLYEFIMMRVPVAVCDFPELIEFLEEYSVGVTFDPQDPQSIAQAVNSHFSRSADSLVAVQNTLESACQRFTWERESLKWLGILDVGGDY